MTAKRFEYIAFDGFTDDGFYITPYKLVELSNELADENEQLKNDVYDWKASAEDYLKLGKSLKKENEQLKSENNMLKHTIGRNEAYIKKLTETSGWHC